MRLALTFLAGLLAAAGVNLLIEGAAIVDSLLWILAAAFLTWAAHILETAERDAALHTDRDMPDEERREVRREHLQRAAPRALRAVGLTGISVLAAVLLLPDLLT